MSPVRRGLALLCVSACSLAACQFPEKRTPDSPQSDAAEGFRPMRALYLDPLYAQRAPANVAVLKLRDATGLEAQSLANLRSFLYQTMMHKDYAPLNPEYVDKVEREIAARADADPATFKDKFPAEGYLVCSISLVDTKVYQETKQVVVQGHVALLQSGTGSTLFEWELSRQVRPVTENGTIKPGQSIAEAAVERFLSVCLDQLPARPAPR